MQQVQSTETVQQRPHPNLPAMDISPPATPPPPGTVPVHDTADPTHTATSLSPSLLQKKAVRSGQPVQRGSRTFSIFSLIQPLGRRR